MNDLDKYLQYRDEMRTGDVVLFASDCLLGRVIRLKTAMSHAVVIVRLPDYEGMEKRRFVLEAHGLHGISLTLLSRKLETYSGRAWWHPLQPDFERARKHIGAWAFGQIGTRYDYGGLFRSIFGRVSESMGALFCSEFAFLCAKKGVINASAAGVRRTNILYARIENDSRKIGGSAAWPGDFLNFTETYREGGQIL